MTTFTVTDVRKRSIICSWVRVATATLQISTRRLPCRRPAFHANPKGSTSATIPSKFTWNPSWPSPFLLRVISVVSHPLVTIWGSTGLLRHCQGTPTFYKVMYGLILPLFNILRLNYLNIMFELGFLHKTKWMTHFTRLKIFYLQWPMSSSSPLPNVNTMPFISYQKLYSWFSFKTQSKKNVACQLLSSFFGWLQVCRHFIFSIKQY